MVIKISAVKISKNNKTEQFKLHINLKIKQLNN